MKFQLESKKGATHSKNGDLHCNGLMAWSVALKINSKQQTKLQTATACFNRQIFIHWFPLTMSTLMHKKRS